MKIFNYDDIYVDVNWRYKRLSIKSGKIEVFSLRLQNIVTSYRKGGIFNPPYVIILSRPPEGFFATPGFDIKSLMVKIQFSDNSKKQIANGLAEWIYLTSFNYREYEKGRWGPSGVGLGEPRPVPVGLKGDGDISLYRFGGVAVTQESLCFEGCTYPISRASATFIAYYTDGIRSWIEEPMVASRRERKLPGGIEQRMRKNGSRSAVEIKFDNECTIMAVSSSLEREAAEGVARVINSSKEFTLDDWA